MIRVPSNRKFVAGVAQIVCLAHGDSWVADDGARAAWSSEVLTTIKAMNQVLRRQGKKAS